MKAFAHFDANGSIRTLVTVNGPEHFKASPIAKPGLFITEIEEDPRLDPTKTDLATLRKLVKNLNIQASRPASLKAK
jgi:hypothetical protein